MQVRMDKMVVVEETVAEAPVLLEIQEVVILEALEALDSRRV
jgi:hypothetical protein